MNKMLLVLKNELTAHVMRRSFLITLFLIPLASFAVMFLVGSLKGTETGQAVSQIFTVNPASSVEGYVDFSGLVRKVPGYLQEQLNAYPSEGAAIKALDAGDVDAYYLISEDYLSDGRVYYIRKDYNPLGGITQSGVIQEVLTYNLLNGEDMLAARVNNPMNVVEEYTAEQAPRDQSEPANFFVPYAVSLAFYIVTLSAASLMLNNITTEKQNRMLEILMTTVTPLQMLTGKIIALGLAGLLQVVIWSGAGYLLLQISGQAYNNPALLQLDASIIFWAAVFFILGYAVYASLMAGLGALVPNLREASQATLVLLIPMIVPYMMINTLITRPNSVLSIILSLFPFSAPVTMITRLAATDVPAWQLILSVILLVVTAVLVVRAVAGMFRAQNLLSGQPFKLRYYFKALFGNTAFTRLIDKNRKGLLR
jgi:ABC-2 type transport system permease protein